MPTLKHRINISLPESIDQALGMLAKRDRVPLAAKAMELLRFALEIEEDRTWDALARQRDTKRAKYISHDKAWA